MKTPSDFKAAGRPRVKRANQHGGQVWKVETKDARKPMCAVYRYLTHSRM